MLTIKYQSAFVLNAVVSISSRTIGTIGFGNILGILGYPAYVALHGERHLPPFLHERMGVAVKHHLRIFLAAVRLHSFYVAGQQELQTDGPMPHGVRRDDGQAVVQTELLEQLSDSMFLVWPPVVLRQYKAHIGILVSDGSLQRLLPRFQLLKVCGEVQTDVDGARGRRLLVL